jgi:pyrimidine operon attenuation protein/uracil phosphoribosyltransferase
MQSNNVQKNCILSAEAIKRKVKRMALEIAEQNADEKELIIAGINGNGEVLAQKLVQELQSYIAGNIATVTIQLNKKQPLQAVLNTEITINDKVVIIVDDVSNTGKTLLYGLKPFIENLPKKIQTAVLVERSHKLFAVQPDYVGLTIATTLQEHITVETTDNELTGAWLH